MATGLEGWGKRLSGRTVLAEWARATAQRNLRSLEEGRGPGGPPLAPNDASTVAAKGNARVGVETGEMAAEIAAPGNVAIRSDTDAQVIAGASEKLEQFLRGRPAETIEKHAIRHNKTKPNTLKRWTVQVDAQPARDFVGHDERVVEAHAEKLLESVAKQLGFVER